jgi:hypothetical protein
MTIKAFHLLRITSVLAASLLAGVPARAQAPDLSSLPTAQALFDAAAKAMAAQDYATACPKLEEVVRLVPEGLGAKLSLARCYEGAGKLASAWTLYSVVEAAAREKERAIAAGRQAAALRPRLAEMTIQVPEAVRGLPSLEIRRDGIAVGPAQWGLAIPVDRGVYSLSATATGKRPWKKTVRVEADGSKIEVVIGPLEDEPGSHPAAPKGAPAPAAPRPAPPVARPLAPKPEAPAPLPAKPAPDAGSGRRTAGFVVGGVGIAGLAVGGIAGGLALGKKQVVDDNCPDLICNKTGSAALDSGKVLGTVSTVGFGVGLAGLATGAVLVLTAPGGKTERSAKAEVRAGVLGAGASGALLGLKGAF